MDVLENVVKELDDCYVEASLARKEVTNLYFENNRFKSADSGVKVRLEIRVTKGLRSAYAWTNNLSNWKECALEAKKLMKASSELRAKPVLSRRGASRSFAHRLISKVTPEILREEGTKAISAANDVGVNVPSLSISREISSISFLNSNLNKCSEQNSEVSVGIECALGDASAWDSRSSNGLTFSIEELGKSTAELCKKSASPKKIKSGLYDVVLDFNALTELLSILIPSFEANNIVEHNSVLIGRLGEQVISPLITLSDKGYLKDSPDNCVVDSEGVRVVDKDIFSKGVLQTFINDIYTAAQMNTSPTGNSGGLVKRGLVSTHNLIIKQGQSLREDMLKDSIYINALMGTHTANVVTGDFALSALNAYDYRGNRPLRDLMISGNVFELLKNVEMVGKNQRTDGGYSLPLIRFKDVQLVG